MAIKVLMIGGRRCGKTSALASLFDQMKNGPINSFFSIYDHTVLERGKISPITNKPEDQEPLISKSLELSYLLENPSTKTFLVDQAPTYNIWTYKLSLSIPGSPKKKTDIEFIDCPGEFFHPGSKQEEGWRLVEECNVYIVAIDTPYLMEDSPTLGKAVNCVGLMQDIFSHANNERASQEYKMVVFVPIKCEKWVKEDRIDEVCNKIKEDYKVVLEELSQRPKMNVAIIPIETAGNIVFSELTEPYTLTRNGSTIKCCKLNKEGTLLRDGKGNIIKKGVDDILNPDINSVIDGNTHLPRKYSWYNIDLKASQPLYAPHNCDQLAIHIIRFMAAKGAIENDGWLWTLIFGGISREVMENKFKEIAKSGLLKENTEGIVYIKKRL